MTTNWNLNHQYHIMTTVASDGAIYMAGPVCIATAETLDEARELAAAAVRPGVVGPGCIFIETRDGVRVEGAPVDDEWAAMASQL